MKEDIRQYLKYYSWEALLALILSTAAILTFAQGFYIPDNIADNVFLALAVSAAVLVFCFAGNYNRRTMILFTVIYLAVLLIILLALRSKGTAIVDEEGSESAVYIYYISGLIIPALVFLLSRFRGGIAVLFLAGTYMYALMDFLKFETRVFLLFVYIIGSIVLFLLRQYRIMTMKNSTLDPEFGKFSGTTTATSVLALGLALLLFVGIVRPLDPPAADMKLLTRLMNYDVLEMLGIAQKYQLPDEWNQSDTENEEQQNTNQQEQNNEPSQDETEAAQGQDLTMADAGASAPEDEDSATGIAYRDHLIRILIALLVLAILAVASLPFVKKRMRKRKMESLRSGPGRQQVINMYGWYLKLLSRLGFKRLAEATEREFAELNEEKVSVYFPADMDLKTLTELFLRARYGQEEISAAECDACASVYPTLLRRYRELNGNFKYLLKYFML